MSAVDELADVAHRLRGWSEAYPTDIFREVSDEERDWLHATRPGLLDRISASMGRHMATCIAEDVAKIETLAAEHEALLARVEGLEADAERYRYLRDEEITREVDTCLQYVWQCEFRLDRKDESLDETIDAARQGA